MLFVILMCVVVAAWSLHWLINCGETMRLYNKIPGPRKLPVLANTLDIITNQVSLFYKMRQWANEYKGVFQLYTPPFRAINIYNPHDVEIILSTSKFNEKSIVYSLLKPWLQEGLLLSYGAKWHSRRKILTPAFHFNILRHFSHILEENSWRLVHDLQRELHCDKTDLIPLMSSYTLNSICESAMGTKLDAEDSGAGEKYKTAIHDFGRILVKRLTRLWMFLDVTFYMLPTGRRHNEILKIIQDFPKHIINERRKYREVFGDDVYIEGTTQESDLFINKTKKRMAMLDLLLTAEKNGDIDADGIQEEVDTFMFEGHDTTSSGLTFTLMLLANHKDVQRGIWRLDSGMGRWETPIDTELMRATMPAEQVQLYATFEGHKDKIFAECENIFGESDRPATMSDLQEMKYLECCVKEGLRLYPPVPFISRRIGENVQLKDYLIPGGTLCHVHIYDLHRRADLFKEPLQFIPERFLTDYGDTKHPYAYIPFSAGPRNCIGQKFALLEMKSAISAILRTYELRPVTKPEDIVIGADLVLRSHNPVYVKFVKRK